MTKIINPFPQYILADKLDINNKDIKKFCVESRSKHPSATLTNSGGYQSPYFHSPTINKNKCLKNLFKQITNKVKIFHNKNLLYSSLGIGNFWVNINEKGDEHLPHNHFGSIVSGTYYVDVSEDCGNLILFNCLHEYKSRCVIEPKNHMLILFPSHFNHYVEPNKTNKKRISISFNYAMNV